MQLKDETLQLLELLEAAIDAEWERRKIRLWKKVLDFELSFADLVAQRPAPIKQMRSFGARINAALEDPEAMLVQQLGGCYGTACARSDRVLNIRTNYGTCILPSAFGAELFIMDDELNTLPTNRPLAGDDPLSALLDVGMPPVEAGLVGRCYETAEYYKDVIAGYPNIREHVWIYHPDFQGPIDVVELLLGSGMFLLFYDQPERLKQATALVSDFYVAALKRWEQVVPRRDPDYSAHWGQFFKGQVMVRDDSLMNLSPDVYREFVMPHEHRVLEQFDGGAVHFCGKVDHAIDDLTDTKWLTAVNMSQPELNDMARIHAATIGRGKVLNCPWNAREVSELELERGYVPTNSHQYADSLGLRP